jgi:tellurite methyltransferase
MAKQTGWDEKWKEEKYSGYWRTPAPAVMRFIAGCDPVTAPAVLDLGCGIGRHALAMAERGFSVVAVDESETAIEALRQEANTRKLHIDTIAADYFDAGFADASFDAIVSYNVIYHGDFDHFKKSVALCRRILKPGGKLFFTCPTREDGKYGNGEKVAAHTYRSENSLHPGDVHYFADEDTLMDVLDRFTVIALHKEEHDWDHDGVKQFSSSWEVTAQRT